MKMKYRFTDEQYAEIKAARKANRDKRIEKRLQVLELRIEGKKLKDISATTGFAISHISSLIRQYYEEGLEAITGNHYHGNRRNMSVAEEAALLAQFQKRAEQGQVLNTREIANAYEKAVGHPIGNSQVYRVLRRHGWRKVMPRSKHPKKASDEVIATSKKITTELQN
jgi:transposase